MGSAVSYCSCCQTEQSDPRARVCPHDGTPLRPRAERGAAWLGQVLDGKYRVLRFVDAGGTAEVLEAERLGSGKRVALKLLHASLSTHAAALALFEQEARLVSLIAHPNVVAIEDFGTLPGDVQYMVMELLEGRSLASELGGRPMAPLRALRFAMQACEGLAAAHERGVIHCDLKPGNFFLQQRAHDPEPILKILDLGIGRLVTTEAGAGGAIAGTPDYMSPEQCQGRALGPSSDVYAMGVVVFEMLLGRMPFEAESYLGVIHAHVHTPAVWPQALAASLGVPPEAEGVVLKALAKNPADRHGSMLELQGALGALVRQLRGGDAAVPSAPPRSSRVPPTAPPASLRAAPPSRRPLTAPVTPSKGPPRTPVVRDDGAEVEALRARVLELERTLAASEHSKRQRAVREAVAALLSDPSSLSTATPRILEAIRDLSGADAGALWLVDRQRRLLRCDTLSARAGADVRPFLDSTRALTFGRGLGLPGRVWASGRPATIADVSRDRNFPRAPAARAAGLQSGFAVPLAVGGEVLGVLEFFTRDRRAPEGDLLATLAELGTELGASFAPGQVREGHGPLIHVPPVRPHDGAEALEDVQRHVERLVAQARAERARGAPIFDIGQDLVALPIAGSLDAERALELAERVCDRVERQAPRALLIDVAAVDVDDATTFEQLALLARAVSELGVRCLFTGVRASGRPAGRSALVGATALPTLIDGIAECMRGHAGVR
ncbi:MAG: protein kinase [Myxococcales bacterium]|nr:protein kinase [Myxococcales bacterium]